MNNLNWIIFKQGKLDDPMFITKANSVHSNEPYELGDILVDVSVGTPSDQYILGYDGFGQKVIWNKIEPRQDIVLACLLLME